MKARITVTVSRVVDLNNDFYEEQELTVTDRLANEIYNAQEMFHDWADADNVEWKTTGELIEEESA
jgi:capsid protein